MSKWLQRTLSEADLQIIDGDRGKNYPSKNDFSEDGFCLFLNAGNVTLRGFDFSNTMFIDAERDKLLRKGKLQRGDVILTTRGTVGNVAYYGNDVDFEHIRINSGMVIIRTVANQLDPRFVYFFLRSRLFANQVKALTTGSAQPQLPIRDMVRISLPNPPICEQVKIASVLGVLDDKIENNRRMNETLEEMARAIFKSWFVDFDPIHAKAAGNTPSHMNAETVALFPSSFGDDGLPIKWEQRKISKFANAVLGGTPSRNNPSYWGGDIPWINSGAVNKFRILEATELITKDGFKNSSTKLLPINTTVIAITGATLGQVSYLEIEVCANQSVVGVISNRDYASEWVYLSLISNIDRLTNLQTGGAQQHINKNDVLNFKVVYPTEEIISSFSAIVRPLFQRIANALRENQILSELRDTLIPKLMTGEIRVKDAEHEVEAAK